MIPPCVQLDVMKDTSSETHAPLLSMNCMNNDTVSRRIVKNTA